ncbi:Zinc finger protein [Plecturocebus cupreus]
MRESCSVIQGWSAVVQPGSLQPLPPRFNATLSKRFSISNTSYSHSPIIRTVLVTIVRQPTHTSSSKRSVSGLIWSLALLPRQEYSGGIMAHCDLHFQGSSDLPPSASLVAGIAVKTESHQVGQIGLDLLTSSDPPARPPKVLGLQA